MGKPINYWLEFEGFIDLAKKAVELGCEIMKAELSESDTTVITVSRDLDIITDDENVRYFFHFPEAGEIELTLGDNGEHINNPFEKCNNSIMEAGFSRILKEEKRIRRAQLFLPDGITDKNKVYIKRPESIEKMYKSIARYLKKLAPYTEITRYKIFPDGGREPFQIKEYVSPHCFEMWQNGGYSLGI